MKALRDEPDDTIKSESEVKPEVEGTGQAEVNKSVGIDKADVGGGVGQAECRSITLHGCGDQSGRDINNAMSLDRFYGRMLKADRERTKQA